MGHANQLNGSEWLKNSFSIWRDMGRDADSKGHPASFPVSLVTRIIDCYSSDPQGLVLDPFAGSGSTLIAALRRGMKTAGVDLNPEYKKVFEERLLPLEHSSERWQYEVCDSRKIDGFLTPESVEICITSPPYWDILNRRRSADGKKAKNYSKSTDDIGNIEDYKDFITSLGDIMLKTSSLLKVGKYCIVNVMDIRKGGKFYPLHIDTISVIENHTDLVLEDIIIWDRQPDYNSMRPLGYPYKFIINKVHEYLLVFKKKEVSNA